MHAYLTRRSVLPLPQRFSLEITSFDSRYLRLVSPRLRHGRIVQRLGLLPLVLHIRLNLWAGLDSGFILSYETIAVYSQLRPCLNKSCRSASHLRLLS